MSQFVFDELRVSKNLDIIYLSSFSNFFIIPFTAPLLEKWVRFSFSPSLNVPVLLKKKTSKKYVVRQSAIDTP